MAQVAELGVGVLELSLDLLFVLLVASLHFVLLMAFVPLGCAANRLHPGKTKSNVRDRSGVIEPDRAGNREQRADMEYLPLSVVGEVGQLLVLADALDDVVAWLEDWVDLWLYSLHFCLKFKFYYYLNLLIQIYIREIS